MSDRISSIEKLTHELAASEQKVKETLARYKALADSTFEGVFIVIDGVCVDVNRAAYENFGYKKEDVIGKNLLEFIHPDYKALVQKNALSPSSFPYEAVAFTKDKKEIVVEVQSKNVQFMDKHVLTVVVRDITDRKKSQESVLHVLELWESTFNSIEDLISLHNLDFEITEVNDAFRKKFGNECLGKKCFEVVHGSCDLSHCKFKSFCDSAKDIEITERWSHTDEVQLDNEWYEVTCSPIISNNRIDGIVHVMKNITVRKKHEEDIIRSNELYKSLLEASSIAILVYEDNVITDVNPAFVRLFGFKSKDDIMYKTICEIGFNHDSVEVLNKKLEQGDRRKFEIAISDKKGEVKIVEVRVRKFVYGEKYGVVAVTMNPIQHQENRRESDNA